MNILELLKAGVNLIPAIVDIVKKATEGDQEAAEKIRRVEEILVDSPTKREWERAVDIGNAKPNKSE